MVATLDGVYQRVTPEAVAYADAKADRAFIREVSLEDALNGKFVEIGIEALDKPIHTLIWGDSHAMAVMPVIDHLCVTHHVRCVGAVHSSTAPILGFASNTKF